MFPETRVKGGELLFGIFLERLEPYHVSARAR